MTGLPRYDPRQTYSWNYEHAPAPVALDVPSIPGKWSFCGLHVDSPLGIPAGPLLNGRWCLYYASLGFDVLTYKTVRSGERECYPVPNLQPVECVDISEGQKRLRACQAMRGSWAISFGMPSRSPGVWRADVEWTRRALPAGKLLVVSVVGTIQPGWNIDNLADDYALCAQWAIESGADAVELNFSCPNVSTCDGQLYQSPEQAARVASSVRDRVGSQPIIVKIGHVPRRAEAEELVSALKDHVTGLSMVNCLSAVVEREAGEVMFGGEPRGIGGAAIYQASLAQLSLFHEICREKSAQISLIGVGGIRAAVEVEAFLSHGACGVQLATAAMLDPSIGVRIREELAARDPKWVVPCDVPKS